MKWKETEASRCRYGAVAETVWGAADIIWEYSYADCQGSATILARTPDGVWWFYCWKYGSCDHCDTWEAACLSYEEIAEEMKRTAAKFDTASVMLRFLTNTNNVGAAAALKNYLETADDTHQRDGAG